MVDAPSESLVPPEIALRGKIVCEFCECQVNSRGEVLRVSDTAKRMRRLDEEVTTLRDQLSAAGQRVATLQEELVAARTVSVSAEDDD